VYYELTDRFEVPASPDDVWAFFSRAENLADITPPWLNFTVETPSPITLHRGALIDHTIRWLGVPIRWRTKIIDWSPPRQFIDLQLRGPYALWHHQHTFKPTDHGTVLCSDHVTYKLPGGPLGRLAQPLMVKRQLLEIFRFRRDVIGKRLGGIQPLADVEIRRA
jgi:ligand-binding SRPBCC domain-containing protein